MISINYRILQAAMVIAPKGDVRYYLNGVLIEPEKVVVTDGNRLLVITIENQRDFEPFIVSRKAIQRLHSQLSAKQRRTGVVNIKLDSDTNYQGVELECFGCVVNSSKIDGKFPEWRRVVPEDKSDHTEDLKFHGAYNWEYMADFIKVAKILDPNKKFYTIELLSDGIGTALVKFHSNEDVMGCIQPIKVKD